MTRLEQEPVCAVILAAGTSSRMGREKQLLPLKGRYLLEWVIATALIFPFEAVFVITGHQSEKIREKIGINASRLKWIKNARYERGQSASFHVGWRAVMDTGCKGAMFFLGDQPFLTEETIRFVFRTGQRRQQQETAPFAIRPVYHGCPGHPVFFGNISGLEVTTVTGDQGGRSLLRELPQQHLLPVSDPFITFDIDTEADYQQAQQIAAALEKSTR
ncbi:molybdenum cofactor cytidylyltransferase [Evansella caseinilytica]|uniref:Molybdenum cofactor cytidylyltransferase n=1 Tax=Evansella caseinilytica TaxID=1503961 RepID=A0A1H3HUQ1_9BACI|nr:molybdenum cofactor cytidylyltransferase [Evansella caseinilytica]